MFTYEEEADPEVFFVPYVWDVVVCALTASSIEWQKERIQVFPALPEEDVTADEHLPKEENGTANGNGNSHDVAAFQDASDFV